ncbi:MAG: c-type cytochrome [Acidobacteriaceae bacterium]
MNAAHAPRLVLLCLLPAVLLGCRAKVPSSAETAIVDWTKHHVTIGGRKDVNPVPALPGNIDDSKQIFASYCMVCHGLDGQNTGVPFAYTLSPSVLSLASPQVQGYTDGQLKWIIKNGLYPSGMPPAGKDFSDDDIWRMVLYIRHLPKAGSLGDPGVYGGSAK